MKTVTSLCVLFALNVLATTTKEARPGQCSKTRPCQDGTCVSVANNLVGVEKVSQCTIEPVCGGNSPGACPTFSSWPPKYKIQPMCQFVDPGNCAESGATQSDNEEDETVTCYNLNVKTENYTVSILGIYKCIDVDLFKETVNMTIVLEEAKESCKGNSTDSQLCNGQGTCSPNGALQLGYKCLCNLGYSSQDNCLEPQSNSCNNLGQCGSKGTCNTSTNECDCLEGTGGNQCAQCISEKGCNENGECQNGKCICNEGYIGEFCNLRDGTSSSSDASSIHLSAMLMMLTIASRAFMAH